MRIKLRYLDWQLLLGVFAAILFGLVIVYSATQTIDKSNIRLFFMQILWVMIGTALMLLVITIPYRFYYGYTYPLFAVSIFLLIIPLLLKFEGTRGAHRWIVLGPIFFQPSELVKLVYIMVLARYFTDRQKKINDLYDLINPILFTIPPIILVMIEPDLGTALSFIAILLIMLFWHGVKLLYLFIFITPLFSMLTSFSGLYWLIFLAGLLVFLYFSKIKFRDGLMTMAINVFSGITFPLLWGILANYQKKRITIFWDPQVDPRGQGWNIIQSMVSIGSGGFWGKGYMQGTQKNLGFLPEQHTDFIFPVIGEEWGFIGCIFVILIFLFIIYRIILLATSMRNQFASYVVIGICSLFVYHLFINIGMTIGLMPVTGIVLPFISYGGSSMLFFLISIGIIQGISLSRSE